MLKFSARIIVEMCVCDFYACRSFFVLQMYNKTMELLVLIILLLIGMMFCRNSVMLIVVLCLISMALSYIYKSNAFMIVPVDDTYLKPIITGSGNVVADVVGTGVGAVSDVVSSVVSEVTNPNYPIVVSEATPPFGAPTRNVPLGVPCDYGTYASPSPASSTLGNNVPPPWEPYQGQY
jgi:hypothetical protein